MTLLRSSEVSNSASPSAHFVIRIQFRAVAFSRPVGRGIMVKEIRGRRTRRGGLGWARILRRHSWNSPPGFEERSNSKSIEIADDAARQRKFSSGTVETDPVCLCHMHARKGHGDLKRNGYQRDCFTHTMSSRARCTAKWCTADTGPRSCCATPGRTHQQRGPGFKHRTTSSDQVRGRCGASGTTMCVGNSFRPAQPSLNSASPTAPASGRSRPAARA